jgi:uncharacterized protein (DUF305 family)
MKKIVSTLAIALFLVTASANAQEVKKEEKKECTKGKQCCKKGGKTCSAKEMKKCNHEGKKSCSHDMKKEEEVK